MTTITCGPKSATNVRLGSLSNEELFVASVFASSGERATIDHELEKRAVCAEIRIMLRTALEPVAAGGRRTPCPS